MLTILLYGDAGAGKSWLGATAPAPRLILDAEGRSRYLPVNAIEWDPVKDQPPEPGDWDTCIVKVRQYDPVLQQVFQWLQSGQTPFRSVILDSITEMQKRFIDKIAPATQLDQQDWGEVLRHLEKTVRDYRDLVDEPSNSVECVVVIAAETEAEGKRRPQVRGGLRRELPYLMDAVGFLYPTYNADGSIQRNLLVANSPTITAKDGTNRLPGPVIAEPNLTEMCNALKG